MKPEPVRCSLTLLLVLFMAVFCTVKADTITWLNTSGGNWSNPANWSPAKVPGSNDTASIISAGNYTVTLDAGATVAGMVLGASGAGSSQTFAMGGQTFTVNGQIQVNSNGQFNVNGGTLAGTNVLTGTLNFNSGYMTGNMTVSSNAILSLSATYCQFSGEVLTNYGTVNWGSAVILGRSQVGAQIYNYGLWNAQGDNTFEGGYDGGTSLFDNFGSFVKTAGTGATTLDAAVIFNNTGTVTVLSGTLSLNGGVTSGGGTFAMTNGGLLGLGNMTFAGNVTISGTNTVQLTGNTTINGVMTAANLQLVSGALYGTNVIVGSLTWSGGYMYENMTLATNGVLNITGGAYSQFYGLVLTNYGTVNWGSATILGRSLVNARIYNYGLWNAQGDNTFQGGYDGGTSLFDNFGSFVKTAGTGTSVLDASVVFNSSGTVTVQSGSLTIAGGGVSSGGYTTVSGSVLNLGNIIFTTNATFVSNGIVELSGNTSITGALSGSNLELVGGTLAGTNMLAGTLTWIGGFMAENLTVATNSVLNIASGAYNQCYGLVLTNYGTINWGSATILGRNNQNAQIYNYGLWNAQGDNTFQGGYDGGTSLFNNYGVFVKSGTVGTSTMDSGTVFNNFGTVTAASGTIDIGRGTSSGGSFTTLSNAAVSFFTTAYNFTGATTFAGSGNSLISGAVFGGTIIGPLTWTGGPTSGSLTIATNGVFNILPNGGNGFYGLVLTNYGTVNWANTIIYGRGALNAQIYNYGLWNSQSDDTFAGGNEGGTTLFDNFGTFLKSGHTGTTTFDSAVVFNNSGTVTVNSGTIVLNGGNNSASGSFSSSNGGSLVLQNMTFSNVNAATFLSTNLIQFGGSTTINGALAIANAQLAGGSLNGTNVLTGTLTWSGGTMAGNMTVASNASFNIVPGGGNGFYGLVLTNYGTVNWAGTIIYGRNALNARIYNYGLWNAQTDNSFNGGNEGGTTIFNNFGTFLKSGNTGTTTLDGALVFNNTGMVTVQSGTLSIGGGGAGSGGFSTTGGSTLSFGSVYNFTNTNVFIGSNSYLPAGATFAGSISGMLNWNGGPFRGAMTVASNGILNIIPGGGNGFYGLVLTNYGTVNWTSTIIYGRNHQNAQIYNYGLWNAQSDYAFNGGNEGGTTLFDNFGTFQKSGSTGTTTFNSAVVFNNAGTISVQSGVVSLGGNNSLANGVVSLAINGPASNGQLNIPGAATTAWNCWSGRTSGRHRIARTWCRRN